MLSAGTTLGAIQGVVAHLDYTLNWRQIQTMRYEQSQKPYYDETAMFGKADAGWRSVFGWIAIYLYNVDSLLVLSWAITLFIGTWNIRMESAGKKNMAIAFKITAVLLPAIMVSICQIKALRHYPYAFLVVVNIIMTVSMVLGFVLVLAILYKYLMSRNIFKRFFNHASSLVEGPSSTGTVSSAAAGARSGNRRTVTDKWLIIRFSIIMLVLIIFEVALIVYELVNFRRSREAKTSQTSSDGPDLSIEQAKVDLFQYIPGVVPSIVAFCIFGTTAEFRREYMDFIRTCCCCCCSRNRYGSSLWRTAQSRSYGRQESVDVEATRRQGSFLVEGKSSIAVEVRTEISLSSISSVKTAAPHRVSFGATSMLSGETGPRADLFIGQTREPLSPQSLSRSPSYGASSRITGPLSPARHSRTLSSKSGKRKVSVDKALPSLSPLPAHPAATSPTISSHPTDRPAQTAETDASLAYGMSWLSADTKSSSIYASSKCALTQSSSNELVSPPLPGHARGVAL
ncbi:hypothetical protein B0J12DRAFT_644412 [Macrophomina phaseolina]|uniref:TRP C-terminal domain-containing protein n=1 Tax=Macrophomina phaseolina TaxID=35725 RepID=A0ABQ8GPR0_9PEZI|nr:hypothetical protein B0J12DRAFT_644412 [Macrophomina phaseolina]